LEQVEEEKSEKLAVPGSDGI